MAERKRKFWGWGYEDQGPTPEQQKHMAERMAKRFDLPELTLTPPPTESELNLRASRVQPPDALKEICSTSTHDRAGAQLWQRLARYHPRVSPLLSESDRCRCVPAR